MPQLLIKYPDRVPETLSLDRLRITIGRSARNDICIPDPFASRVHAEIRREGDEYILRDLNSANGTYYNAAPVEQPIALSAGGRIQIGETEIQYQETPSTPDASGATMIADASVPLAATSIAVSSGNRTTSGLLEAIEAIEDAQATGSARLGGIGTARSSGVRRTPSAQVAEQNNLLALIGKVGVTLLSSASLDETLRQVVALVFEAVPADRCLIALRDETTDELKIRVARLRGREGEAGEFRLSRAVIEEVTGRGNSVLTSDVQQDPRFMSRTMSIQGVRSVLAVPLGVGDKIFGLVYADSPLAESMFTEDHLKVLTTLASVAAIRVENTHLLEKQIERERMERELQLAREIQQRFQPAGAPAIAAYELEGISFPCNEIGGDYYDFIKREDGRTLIALGDVSGKGTAAALLMSSLHAAVHAQVSLHHTLVETATAVNIYLAENIPSNRFVTFFCAEIDPAANVLRYLNAGHNPPFIVRAGSGRVEPLDASSMPLGISARTQFSEGRTQMSPGDVLVIYSDGVSETNNQVGEEFGEKRLHDVVQRNAHCSAPSLRDAIESALTKFAQGTPAADDITLVILKAVSSER